MKWKNRLKTVLEETAAVENSRECLKTQLRKTAETTKTEVFAVNRSDKVRHFPKIYSENVFDYTNEAGTKVIQHLYRLGEKHKEVGKEFIFLNQPTIEAYEAELNLVDGIRQREAKNITAEDLKTLIENYIKTHSPDAENLPDKWTGANVPLMYFRILLNGEELEAYTCNEIQSQIIGAIWQTIHPEAGFSVMPL